MFILILISRLIKAVDTMLVRIAILDIPVIMMNAAITLPAGVMGYISPYPTVVIVTILHHRASHMFLNCGFMLCSAININMDDIIMNRTNVKKNMDSSKNLSFRI